MKYKTEVIINLPREKVIEKFDGFENMKKWQKGLKSYEHVSGEVGRTGAQTKLVYDGIGRNVEIIETIIKRDLPNYFVAKYETKGVKNINYNHFHLETENSTKWVADNEFEFKGMMSLMSIFNRGEFKKQTLKDMIAFKDFA
ncbi:MAG: SRPBCC family protein [Candidatus Heimdallarchaeaceae archaeon]